MGILRSIPRLIKYKLSLAVTLSAVAGFFLFNGRTDVDILILMAGVFCLAGGSSALNQVQEWERDSLMNRTSGRPIPTGQIQPKQGVIISALFILAGALTLWSMGWLPMTLGILNILLYNGVYTWLKPRSSFAVLPGGLVGAIPPIIGWTAAGGSLTHPNIIFIAALMFLWQMPHFWLLIIRYGKEYEAAGFATLNRRLGDGQIKRLVIWWMAISLLFLLTAPLFDIEFPTWLLILIALINLLLIGFFYLILFRTTSEKMLRLVFILTNVFLTLVLLALIMNSLM